MLDLSGGMFGGDGILDLGRSGMQFVQQSNSYSKYNFYVDFADGKGKDRVSGTLMQTTLEAGRVNADGSALGEDVPAILDGELNTFGGFTVLNGMSNDISDDCWLHDNLASITANSFMVNARFGGIKNLNNTIETTKYTITFYAYVGVGKRTTGFSISHYLSASGNQTFFALTEVRKRYSITFFGRIGDGNINIGIIDENISDWTTVYIDTINITETPYAMPPVINTTASWGC